MHVTKITIGRLFNLGNYKHVRYELTVEVPAGASVQAALEGAETVIEELSPKKDKYPELAAKLHELERRKHSVSMMSMERIAHKFGRSRAYVHAARMPPAAKESMAPSARATGSHWERAGRCN